MAPVPGLTAVHRYSFRDMIDSMTTTEKVGPSLVDRRPIATGVGVRAHKVEQLLVQFGEVLALLKRMATIDLPQDKWSRGEEAGFPNSLFTSKPETARGLWTAVGHQSP